MTTQAEEMRDLLDDDPACALAASSRANQPPGTAGRIYKAALLGLAGFAIVALCINQAGGWPTSHGVAAPDMETTESLFGWRPPSISDMKKNINDLKQKQKDLKQKVKDKAKDMKEKIKDKRKGLSKGLLKRIIRAGANATPFSDVTYREKVKDNKALLKSASSVLKVLLKDDRFLTLGDGFKDVAKEVVTDPWTYQEIDEILKPEWDDIRGILQNPFRNRRLQSAEMLEVSKVVLGVLVNKFARLSEPLVETKKANLTALHEYLQKNPDFQHLTSALRGRRLSSDDGAIVYLKFCPMNVQLLGAGSDFCIYFPLLSFEHITFEVSPHVELPDEFSASTEMGIGFAPSGGFSVLGGQSIAVAAGADVSIWAGLGVEPALNLAFATPLSGSMGDLLALDLSVSVGPSGDLPFPLPEPSAGYAIARQFADLP